MKKTYDVKRYRVVAFRDGQPFMVEVLLPDNDNRAMKYADAMIEGEVLKVTPMASDTESITLEMPDDIFNAKARQISADKRRNMVSRTMTKTDIDCIYWDGTTAARTNITVSGKLDEKKACKVDGVLKVFNVNYMTELVGVDDVEFYEWCMDNK